MGGWRGLKKFLKKFWYAFFVFAGFRGPNAVYFSVFWGSKRLKILVFTGFAQKSGKIR